MRVWQFDQAAMDEVSDDEAGFAIVTGDFRDHPDHFTQCQLSFPSAHIPVLLTAESPSGGLSAESALPPWQIRYSEPEVKP